MLSLRVITAFLVVSVVNGFAAAPLAFSVYRDKAAPNTVDGTSTKPITTGECSTKRGGRGYL